MTVVRGFDISHYNASANLGVAKRAGFGFVYLKATEGVRFVDDTFALRKQQAAAEGLPAGAYLFLQPDQPVAEQVAHFIEVVGDMPLRVALDHETRSSRGAAATAAAARNAMTLLVKHYGYAPVLYCDRSFIVEGLCEGLGGFPLWVADYSGGIAGMGRHAGARQTAAEARMGTARRAATRPHIPSGPWSDYAIWQTGQANVAGVTGGDGPATDVNVCPNLALITAPGKPAPSPTPTPDPAPADSEDPMLVIRAIGRVAAIVDDAGVGHPISSAKWSAVNHTAETGAAVDIVTISAADWDAYVPAAQGKKVDHTEYDAFTHPDTAEPLRDRIKGRLAVQYGQTDQKGY